LVVVGSIDLQNATQLRFVEPDQMIESVAPNRSDEALDVAAATVSAVRSDDRESSLPECGG